MKNICLVEQMQRTIRVNVCPGCQFCPQGRQALGSEVMRPCEPDCCIMRNLPKLYMAASIGVSPQQYETVIQERICKTCEASPTAGDFCTQRFTRSCPLSVYGLSAMEALERLAEAPSA